MLEIRGQAQGEELDAPEKLRAGLRTRLPSVSTVPR